MQPDYDIASLLQISTAYDLASFLQVSTAYDIAGLLTFTLEGT